MEEQADVTPAAFLSELGSTLKSSREVDPDLANLISQHILTAAPDKNCVEHVSKAMAALADARAITEANSDG
ncbi:MAG: hypothetical protein QOG23_1025 [Blastocatellia bacterium]|jgi:hypothetical protein|nr:hypothetical protein [Blastocatellia bacterium]